MMVYQLTRETPNDLLVKSSSFLLFLTTRPFCRFSWLLVVLLERARFLVGMRGEASWVRNANALWCGETLEDCSPSTVFGFGTATPLVRGFASWSWPAFFEGGELPNVKGGAISFPGTMSSSVILVLLAKSIKRECKTHIRYANLLLRSLRSNLSLTVWLGLLFRGLLPIILCCTCLRLR